MVLSPCMFASKLLFLSREEIKQRLCFRWFRRRFLNFYWRWRLAVSLSSWNFLFNLNTVGVWLHFFTFHLNIFRERRMRGSLLGLAVIINIGQRGGGNRRLDQNFCASRDVLLKHWKRNELLKVLLEAAEGSEIHSLLLKLDFLQKGAHAHGFPVCQRGDISFYWKYLWVFLLKTIARLISLRIRFPIRLDSNRFYDLIDYNQDFFSCFFLITRFSWV